MLKMFELAPLVDCNDICGRIDLNRVNRFKKYNKYNRIEESKGHK